MSAENNNIDANYDVTLRSLETNVEILLSWINKEGDESCNDKINKSIGESTDHHGNQIPQPIDISHGVSIYASPNGALTVKQQQHSQIIFCTSKNYSQCIKQKSVILKILKHWWSTKQNKDEVVEQLLTREVTLGKDDSKTLTIKITKDNENKYVLNAYIKVSQHQYTIFMTVCGDDDKNIKTCLDEKFGISGGKRKSRRTRKGKSKNKKRKTNRRRH
jgi:hypothetical protein